MNRTLRLFLLFQLVVGVIGAFGCGGDESKNECADEQEIELNAIGETCANFQSCCYCSCELSGVPTADCDCTAWGPLVRDRDVSQCQGANLNTAMNCVADETNCSFKAISIVNMRCSQ